MENLDTGPPYGQTPIYQNGADYTFDSCIDELSYYWAYSGIYEHIQ